MSNPIPDFDHNYVLPPHKGNPTSLKDLSPYQCTSLQFCEKFATSQDRIIILTNFLKFRDALRNQGLTQGFQWLDGSFLENIEILENRSPRDLDLVTIYWGYSLDFQKELINNIPDFGNPRLSKANYKLDHYPFDVNVSSETGITPQIVVEFSRYWSLLFSHNRNGVWKGMLSINLDTPDDDAAALKHLQGVTL